MPAGNRLHRLEWALFLAGASVAALALLLHANASGIWFTVAFGLVLASQALRLWMRLGPMGTRYTPASRDSGRPRENEMWQTSEPQTQYQYVRSLGPAAGVRFMRAVSVLSRLGKPILAAIVVIIALVYFVVNAARGQEISPWLWIKYIVFFGITGSRLVYGWSGKWPPTNDSSRRSIRWNGAPRKDDQQDSGGGVAGAGGETASNGTHRRRRHSHKHKD